MRSPIVLAAALSLFPFAIQAQDQSRDEPRFGSCQLYWENDSFLPGETTDEYYTNGFKLAWMHNPNREGGVPEWSRKLMGLWCEGNFLCPDGDPEYGYGHALGQNMYTPNDLTNPNPQPDDRPWAGYLYYSWISEVTHRLADQQDVQNLFELQVGLVGPGAGARFAQTAIHELNFLDAPKPLGWSNQLRNEPTVNLNYQWRKKIGSETFDIVPNFGFGLGTVMTFANAGATMRIGRHIQSFPQLLITPANAATKLPEPLEYYIFVGGDGRFVAHNIFLDGNTFRDGQEINLDRNDFVFDLKAGFAVRYKAWRFDYTWVRRGEELKPPRGRRDGEHTFGAVAFSWVVWWG